MRRWLPVGAGVLVAIAACEQLIGADFDQAEARATPDAGSDATVASCDSLKPQPKPDVTDGGGDIQLSVVLTDVEFGETPGAEGTPGYQELGFDLDDTCTNRGDAPVCTPAAWTEGDPTDGPRGQDNGVGYILAVQEKIFGLPVVTETLVNNSIAQGRFAPLGLVIMEGYNGFEVDDQVTVKWYVTLPGDVDTTFEPKLDGTDVWPIATMGSVFGGSDTQTAMLEDTAAFVNKRRLVARFPNIRVPLASVYLEGRDMVLEATVTFDVAAQKHKLTDGLIAGWCYSSELLRVIPAITIDFLGVPLCTDGTTYATTKKFICSGADLATKDHVTGQPCDAVSWGIGFQSRYATVGNTLPLPPPKAKCPDATNPAGDTCDTP